MDASQGQAGIRAGTGGRAASGTAGRLRDHRVGPGKMLVVNRAAVGGKNVMPNLTASIPHQMARVDAKRRIQDQVGMLRQQHGSMFSELKETWAGDRMDFA